MSTDPVPAPAPDLAALVERLGKLAIDYGQALAQNWDALAEADGFAPAWEDLAKAIREAAGLLDRAATILDQEGLT